MRTAILVGIIGELRFHKAAVLEDLICCRPYADFYGYDFITDHMGTLNRVQVKAASAPTEKGGNSYKFHLANVSFDFIAMQPGDTRSWYIMPVKELLKLGKNGTTVNLHVGEGRRWSKYKDAWHLLKEKRKCGKK
jgi:hypothetical protein